MFEYNAVRGEFEGALFSLQVNKAGELELASELDGMSREGRRERVFAPNGLSDLRRHPEAAVHEHADLRLGVELGLPLPRPDRARGAGELQDEGAEVGQGPGAQMVAHPLPVPRVAHAFAIVGPEGAQARPGVPHHGEEVVSLARGAITETRGAQERAVHEAVVPTDVAHVHGLASVIK